MTVAVDKPVPIVPRRRRSPPVHDGPGRPTRWEKFRFFDRLSPVPPWWRPARPETWTVARPNADDG